MLRRTVEMHGDVRRENIQGTKYSSGEAKGLYLMEGSPRRSWDDQQEIRGQPGKKKKTKGGKSCPERNTKRWEGEARGNERRRSPTEKRYVNLRSG